MSLILETLSIINIAEMSLRCLGSWQANNGNRYTIMENIEKEEYRCGVRIIFIYIYLLEKTLHKPFLFPFST